MLINRELLDKVSAAAKRSERLRMNYNFHDSLAAPSQRLLNALEPGTVMPVHRHRHTSETYILIRGAIKMMFYNDSGDVTESVILSDKNDNFGYNIPVGQWHSLEVLEPDTVIFETKDGPYAPLSDDDILR
ncbi:MAG: WbuC family cupin fold metalloprotein [Salinivirgaceae bacterium]|nr:WbuC family cupin fold metalloprotein [Salinivirgaceae bacterium]